MLDETVRMGEEERRVNSATLRLPHLSATEHGMEVQAGEVHLSRDLVEVSETKTSRTRTRMTMGWSRYSGELRSRSERV